MRGDLALEVVVEDLGATHGTVEGHGRDVPSADLHAREASAPTSTRQSCKVRTTMSLGWTMGSTSENGTWTSLPSSSLPRRSVEARTSEPR